ncbi:MAG: nucleoside-diphosphate kinase [bacterium]|nr:nucleoside-diphosphate kinase [bacterium]
MAVERTLVNIYWSALERSITGDIISMIRFIPELNTQLRVIGADMYDLTTPLARALCKTLPGKLRGEEKEIQNRFKEMLVSDVNYDRGKYNLKRVFNLVLEGENAVEIVNRLMGDIRLRNGISILGRYGFFKQTTLGEILVTEFPASAPSSVEEAKAQIEIMWKKHKSCGGSLKHSFVYPDELKDKVDCSVVIVKPNVFNNPHDPRLGDVINSISRAGMYIIGAKVQSLTPEQAKEFYLPHKGKHFYDELVDFMSNKKSLALLYEGVNAREKIRNAALNVIRGAYSDDILANTVHTSETKEDFLRESAVVDFEVSELMG